MKTNEELIILGANVELTRRRVEKVERQIIDAIIEVNNINVFDLQKLRNDLLEARADAVLAYHKFVNKRMGE